MEKGVRPDIPPEIFKAYDIRGIVGQTLTPAVVEIIGRSIGSELRERGGNTICIGRDGRLHSAHFFELSDQPIEVTLVVTEDEWNRLAQALTAAQANVFFTKTPVEFGVLGGPDPGATPAAAG